MQPRITHYPGFAPALLDQAKKHLRPLGFLFHAPAFRGALFEQAFIDCYGREALDRVTREFPVIDMNGRTRWVDYFIRTRTGDLATFSLLNED